MFVKLLTKTNPNFPEKLKHLHKKPQRIYITGDSLSALEGLAIGIVGSRKVSEYGRSVTGKLAEDLAREGVTIISGLAFGVDSIAHESALRAKGKTIAVLPSGVKNIYPATHRTLAKRIAENNGLLVSEYPPDVSPMKHQFIERNRIIAALSDALLITEAAESSGSLHAARFALEIGREVFAVPGNITSPTSIGTNNLIKAGATPVTQVDDILDALGINKNINIKKKPEIYGDSPGETTILQLLYEGSVNGSELFVQSKMDSSDYQRHLTMLEIKGRIRPLGNDNWRIV